MAQLCIHVNEGPFKQTVAALVITVFLGDLRISFLLLHKPSRILRFCKKYSIHCTGKNTLYGPMLYFFVIQAWYAKTPLGKARAKALMEGEEPGKAKGKGKDKRKKKGEKKGKKK